MGQDMDFKRYAEMTLREVRTRLRNQVPFQESTNIVDVAGLLHRMAKCDFVTLRRFSQLARRVLELSGMPFRNWQAGNLVAQTLGYPNQFVMRQNIVDERIPNLRKVKVKASRQESANG